MNKLKLVVSNLIAKQVETDYTFDKNFFEVYVSEKQTVFYNGTHDVTVVLSIKPRGYIIHFMDGTQEKHKNYFSQTIALELVEVACFVITAHLNCELSKKEILNHNKV